MKKKRLILTVPDDLVQDITEVKQLLFHDKSYSEMYRQLIRTGLHTLKEKETRK